MKIIQISLLACALMCPLATMAYDAPPLSGQTYAGMVVFGDSLSDASTNGTLAKGNNTAIQASETYYNSATKTADKLYTSHGAPISNNGFDDKALLWDNDLLHVLETSGVITSNTPLVPIFDASSVDVAATDSFNYAYASAETGDQYLNDLSSDVYPPYDTNCKQPGMLSNIENCVPGVNKQIDLYIAAHKLDADFTRRLYFIFAGGNDIFNNISKLMHHSGTHSDYSINLLKAVKKLHDDGVDEKHIVLIGIPELAKSPAASAFLSNNHTIEDLFNALLIEIQNAALQFAIQGKATWYDVGPIFQKITSGPYTFSDPNDVSQRYTLHYLGGAKKQPDGKYYTLDCATAATTPQSYAAQLTTCAQASGGNTAFFNSKHPSALMHLALASDMYSKLFKGA